jgi:hypothetical protein
MGDSMVVINWSKGLSSMQNFILKSIYEEMLIIKSNINEVLFYHVYKERNMLANRLSRISLQMAPSTWHIWKQQADALVEYDPGPFV